MIVTIVWNVHYRPKNWHDNALAIEFATVLPDTGIVMRWTSMAVHPGARA